MQRLKALCLAFVLMCMAVVSVNAQELSKLEPITIATAEKSILLTAEIADTDELRSRGLMFRHRLPEGRAMLFDFDPPRAVSMWMKNTYISLDMLFVRPDGTIAAIAENTVPKSLDTISVPEPVRGVVELPAGTARKLGIKPDDLVYHRIFNTVAVEPAFGDP